MKNSLIKSMRGTGLTLGGLAALAMPFAAMAGGTEPSAAPAPETTAFSQWWNGKYIDGDWGGVRNTLEEHGIDFNGAWLGNYYHVGGADPHFSQKHHGAAGLDTFDQQLKIKLKLDFEKMFGVKGLTLDAMVRYRDGSDPGPNAGIASKFDPSNYEGGKGWRLMPVFLTWKSEDLLWTKDALVVRGGWMNPWDFFIAQDNALFFVNNQLNSARGIGANIPWSSSFTGWGGMIAVKPVKDTYVQAGVFTANNNATQTQVIYNGEREAGHGLPFQGAPYNAQGIEFIAEAGYTPKIGPDKLEGKYAVGYDYWGLNNNGYLSAEDGNFFDNKQNFYLTADQMLFREPSAPETKAVYSKDGKDGKSMTVSEPEKLSDQGLYFCGMANFARSENNAMPFYFQAGLLYKGLIPTRDHDKLGAMFGYGAYSQDQFSKDVNSRNYNPPDNESVLEVDYQFQVNKWSYVKPFYQWIHRPNGTGLVGDANVIGVQAGVTF